MKEMDGLHRGRNGQETLDFIKKMRLPRKDK